MPGVSIEGERQTPDIFFVFPTGKGGNLSAPKVRDYGPDILEPVVKPWFERDQMVTPPPLQAASTKSSVNWDELMKSSPPPARPAPEGEPAALEPPPAPPPSAPSQMTAPSLPPPSIPSQALSLPRSGAPPPPSMPPASFPPRSSVPSSPPSGQSLNPSGPLYPPGSRPWVPPAGGSSRTTDSEGVPVLAPQ